MTPDPRATLEAALSRSGLSLRRFATGVLSRDERTVRYWPWASSPLPPAVRANWDKHPTPRIWPRGTHDTDWRLSLLPISTPEA